MKFTTQLYTYVLVLGALLCVPAISFADNVTITNSFSSSANSGGNYAAGGEVVEGSSTNTTSVHTLVNGEVVEDYTESSSEPIEYHNTYTSETNNVSIETHTEASTETSAPAPTENPGFSVETYTQHTEATETETKETKDETEEVEDIVTSATTSTEVSVAATTTETQLNVINKVKLAVVTILSYVFKWFN